MTVIKIKADYCHFCLKYNNRRDVHMLFFCCWFSYYLPLQDDSQAPFLSEDEWNQSLS